MKLHSLFPSQTLNTIVLSTFLKCLNTSRDISINCARDKTKTTELLRLVIATCISNLLLLSGLFSAWPQCMWLSEIKFRKFKISIKCFLLYNVSRKRNHNSLKHILFTDGSTCVIHSASKIRTTKKRKLKGIVCQVVNQQRVNEVWAVLLCYLLHVTANIYA
jgi:hypothetical protein